ncbi:MAG: hypothetical protein FGM54_00160 [Chitinophagaceae bacterium]|nr:hypothetical protein [Chitinophagaceae bacterium]
MWAFDSNIKEQAVRDYILNLEPKTQIRFIELAEFFHSLLPNADIVMKYGMPTFFLQKSILHIAGWTSHCGLYPQAEAIKIFAEDLKGYPCSKGAIQIPHDRTIPFSVLGEIALYRLKQVLELKSNKK